MLTRHSQRWRDGRTIFVDGPHFDASAYSVSAISEAEGRDFVASHHYLKTSPARRHSVGLHRHLGGRPPALVGVAVFSTPMTEAVVPKYTGLESAAGAELGRLVLLDDVPLPGESWFMARAFSDLRRAKPRIEGVVAYADPAPRWDATGAMVKRGHIGKAYQSLSASHRGVSGSRSEWRTPAGALVSERAMSKIRSGDTGWRYAVDQLVAAGASPPVQGADLRQWLAGLKRDGFLRRSAAPGKLIYAWALTRRARHAGKHLPRHPYPKIGDPNAADVTALPLFA